MDNALSFLLGLTAGATVALLVVLATKKPDQPDSEDPNGKIKQQISDKLDKAIKDIQSTV